MNNVKLFQFPFSLLINIATFILFFLPELSLCTESTDKHFSNCYPISCGSGPNISYPFWVSGRQEPYCGFPGFSVFCRNREPIINMSGNDYIIQNIFDKNHSVLVANTRTSDQKCPVPVQNFTLPGTRFEFGPAHVNLFLFLNCTAHLPTEILSHRIDCVTGDPSRRSLAFFSNDPILKKNSSVLRDCGTSLVAPVDHYGDVSEATVDMNYTELLRKGFLLKWKANDCSECEESGGRCGFNLETYKFACFCPHRPHLRHCHRSNGRNLTRKLLTGFLPAGFLLVVSTVLICWFTRRNSSEKLLILGKKGMKNGDLEAFLRNHGSLAQKRYRYSAVKKMTNSFKDKLGQGAFGGVYKGKLIDGRLVAVKVLSESKGNGEEFINEVASISRTSHVNVVNLLGFCFEGSKRALIYEFMPNGSLEKIIYDEQSMKNRQLRWEKLHQITVGIARGLEYLHRGCNTRILHLDIKPHNILLDEDLCPKISDFGLAKLCNRKESIISMLGARGTPGYIAPEVFSRNFGGVSHKSDVYSYGMMVLEMVGGRKNIDVGVDKISEIYFPHWIYKNFQHSEHLRLHGIFNEEDDKIARKMVLVGLWCIQNNPSDRPSISKVLEMLEGSLESIQIPPKPFLSSPSRSLAGSPARSTS